MTTASPSASVSPPAPPFAPGAVPAPAVAHGPRFTGETERIDRIVAGWARATPDAVALVDRGRSVTYRALWRRVGEVVADLAAAGAGTGDVVAVQLPRGAELAATLLAVLARDAAYLVLDEQWPPARRAEAVRRCGARLLFGPHGPEPTGHAGPAEPLPGDGAQPCAVFFTSGSTGTPKAVLSTHAGLIRIARDPLLALGTATRMFQTAPVPWDAFSLELWAPLVVGGSTVLHDGRLPTVADVRAAVAAGVNTLFLTTGLFHAFIDEDPGCFAGLTLLMTGGDRVSPRRMAACRAAHPALRLLDVYGPVEGTVFATAHEVGPAPDPARDLPIGRPMAGTSVYVLDERLRTLPRGATGEIALAGAGLAVGYLGDRAGTDGRFPQPPLAPDGGPLRVYLTGDLGRMTEDGELEILGRRDRQLKIRGVRVDPAEVERHLEEAPGAGIRQAVVVPVDGGPDGIRLEAFCVPRDPQGAPAPEDVRSAVAALLPSASVPARVHLLPRLPLTATGKTDIRRLPAAAAAAAPAPDGGRRGATGPGGSPASPNAVPHARNPLDAVVRHAQELLRVPVGADDDLFDLGATSLTAIRLAGRLGQERDTTVSAATVMRARTPARIAELLDSAAR